MTPNKRKKITALMNNAESTENEKAVCRKILKDNPEEESEDILLEDLRRYLATQQAAGRQWEAQQQAWAQQAALYQQDEAYYYGFGQAQHPHRVYWGPIVKEKPPEKISKLDTLLGLFWRWRE